MFPDRAPALDDAPEPGLSPESAAPESAALSDAERSPYRAVFADTFAQAYDTPAEPARGARVMADVAAEARAFGDEWTVQSLDAERFGAAARPELNDWLAASLRTEAGEEAVLHALKDGAPTPGRGEDLVVLLDREAAFGMGHTAVLVGNDHTGWDLYSKDGSANSNMAYGPSTWTNERGRDQTTGRRSQHFETLDAFFERRDVSGRFEAAVRVEFEPGMSPDMGNAVRRSAEAIISEPYNVATSSCAHVTESALEIAGAPGFSLTVTGTSASGNPIHSTVRQPLIGPKAQFSQIRTLEGADDRRSTAQQAWERRSATDGI